MEASERERERARRRKAWEAAEEARAAQEAAELGGRVPDTGSSLADRPVREAGGGEAEGFEQAEAELIEHASHGDEQSAHWILRDRGPLDAPQPARADGEADRERSSEVDDADLDGA